MEVGKLLEKVTDVSGVPVLAASVNVSDMTRLRQVMDDVKVKVNRGIIVLGAVVKGKVQLVARVSPDLVEEGYHAGKLVKEVAALRGRRRGRPDMAQAGGKNPGQLQHALAEVPNFVDQMGKKA